MSVLTNACARNQGRIYAQFLVLGAEVERLRVRCYAEGLLDQSVVFKEHLGMRSAARQQAAAVSAESSSEQRQPQAAREVG